jgi:hypothetical protein
MKEPKPKRKQPAGAQNAPDARREALQQAAGPLVVSNHGTPDLKGLDFIKAMAVDSREDGRLKVVSKKTRDQICDELCADVSRATGTSLEVADRILTQMMNAAVWPHAPKETTATEHLIKAISRIAEYSPRNVTEADLAVQMTATNDAALLFLRRAAMETDLDIVDRAVANATRFSRLFLQQVDAMQRLKGLTGQQKIVVERVEVQAGGQAVVGAIAAPCTTGEGGGK